MGKRDQKREVIKTLVVEKEDSEELEAAELDLSSDDDAEVPSGSDVDDAEENDEQAGGSDEELREALIDYHTTAARLRDEEAQRGETNAQDGEEDDLPEDPGSDSSEDERPNRNTVGEVPLKWYKDEDHIGYDVEGNKLLRKARKDKLDALLDRNDSKKALRTIYDEYNDEEITLSKEELSMIMRIRKGQFPSVAVNPYEPYVDWFSREREVMPINDAPIPKRRFIPSKHEEKKIVKLVRAIRKGWIKTSDQTKAAEEPPVYLLWADDNLADGADKSASGLTYIPAAKPKLPGHAESYNPPKEYLPTEEEKASWELMDPEDRPKFVPQAFDSLRHVPMYNNFIKEVFERCLDLYLCPRVRKKRMHIDPESLVPKLPHPRDLQPFPTTLAVRYEGHTGKVRSVAPDATGQWLLSGADDGSVKLWEVRSGRCMKTWELGSAVQSVAWCPAASLRVVSAVAGNRVVMMPAGLGGPEAEAAARQALQLGSAPASGSVSGPAEGELAAWVQRPDGGLEVLHRFPVKHLTWHTRGDYFSSVAPTGNTQAVLVHQLSKRVTQNPFRKNRGRVQRVAFHPTKPFFFVATQNHVRIYNLAKQALSKKLIGGSGTITCLAVHPSGDHVIVGSEDKRLAWYDLDLSDKPYKALRYHTYGLRGVAFHRTYPLFASSSDDATVHVFHGMVYSDLMSNPLIVPVKILRGHDIVDYSGVLDVAFHPTQPWVFTAGADSTICLFCN
mmetsp:Transcript_31118/g.69148  ORF Transcript_31118/g.69148 Transcript_31118/m.69148 type:complete len:730 (-) Transcript_31118:537-2726(-)|eukprot:CAMPEP_0202890142 /NCGR_PEP_ID=MMETSP1392-20130828/642_1 /ASSEMBLY_ACC=CAM_ASM_000868 /TAXON_ID=225041 /ORGANISM="Chlamydomonas chlamydogama, Strain SAG 11-48b" /LENGTH=729 /DNA_ID=CAMNT_0049573657 /DNA_START=142 /DNA_END=2331 /DNA_ORIENTATION=+